MATFSTITNVPFSFDVLDAGMGTNTLDDLATAKWQYYLTINLSNVNVEVTTLEVEFVSTTDSYTYVETNAVSLVGNSPVINGTAELFPDLNYSVGVEELTAVNVSGTFTFEFDSASPVDATTEFTAGLRYNKTGTAVAGVLSLGGANDPSALSTDFTEFDGVTNTCQVGRVLGFKRFGPQKIKFHRAYSTTVSTCLVTA
jgi:hypothetical protein